jgi:hypothetical protein
MILILVYNNIFEENQILISLSIANNISYGALDRRAFLTSITLFYN